MCEIAIGRVWRPDDGTRRTDRAKGSTAAIGERGSKALMES